MLHHSQEELLLNFNALDYIVLKSRNTRSTTYKNHNFLTIRQHRFDAWQKYTGRYFSSII